LVPSTNGEKNGRREVKLKGNADSGRHLEKGQKQRKTKGER